MGDSIRETSRLPFKVGLRYVATTASDDGLVQVGTPIWITKDRDQGATCYTLYGMMRVGRLKGRHEHNDVRRFYDDPTKRILAWEQLAQALAGADGVLDVAWARERVDEHQLQIADLEEDYGLAPGAPRG
jgi:hypothetical protein